MLNISYFQMAGAILGMLIILILMLVYLLVRKKIEQKKLIRIHALKEKIRPRLIDELLKGNASAMEGFRKDKVFLSALEENLKDFSVNFDSDSYKQTIPQTAEKYLADSVSKELSSSRWGDRMNALAAIKEFRLYSFIPRLWELYDKPRTSVQEKNLILQTAASADDDRLLHILVTSPPYQSIFFYKQIIRRLSPEMLDSVIAGFPELPSGFKVAVLSYIGEKRDLSLLTFVESCLESEDHEVRVNALKAVRSIGFISKPETLYRFADSGSWVEQMGFAQAAGELSHPGFKEPLAQLLSSPNWWVRYYSGEALSKFKDGKTILKDTAANHQDSFARDMASQWLGSV